MPYESKWTSLKDHITRTALAREERLKQQQICPRACLNCGNKTARIKFCSDTCREAWILVQKQGGEAYPVLGSTDLGAASEYAVVFDLLRRGYDVYKGMSPGSLVDLIAMDKSSGKLSRIQVRSGELNFKGKILPGSRSPAPEHDVLATVTKEGLVQYIPDMPPSLEGSSIS